MMMVVFFWGIVRKSEDEPFSIKLAIVSGAIPS